MVKTYLQINNEYKVLYNLGLKFVDIGILAKIEEFEKNNLKCYMSNENFSTFFGESESTIKRILDKLEKSGYIIRQTETSIKGGYASKQRVIFLNEARFKMNLASARKIQKEKDEARFKMNLASGKNSGSKGQNEPSLKGVSKGQNEPSLCSESDGSKVQFGPSLLEESKVQNEPKQGSIWTEARFKLSSSEVQIDPIIDKEIDKGIDKEAFSPTQNACCQSPTPADAGPPAAQPSEKFSFNDKLIIRMKLKSGIKKSEVVRELKENDNIKVTIKELDKIWDEYKGNDGLSKLKELASKEKSSSTEQAKVNARDKLHYEDIPRLHEVIEVFENNIDNGNIELSELEHLYNELYDRCKDQSKFKYNFTVDEMIDFVMDYKQPIKNISELKEAWIKNISELNGWTTTQ